MKPTTQMKPFRTCIASALLLSAFLLSSCDFFEDSSSPESVTGVFLDFEGGFYDFNEEGDFIEERKFGDLEESNWFIEINSSSGFESSRSLELYLDNREPEDEDGTLDLRGKDGRVWIEVNLGVDVPVREYDVEVAFMMKPVDQYSLDTTFTGRDIGDQWSIIANSSTDSPEELDDLFYHSMPSWSMDQNGNWEWVQRSYSFKSISDGSGTIHIAVGVSGERNRQRAYLIDDLRIQASREVNLD